MRNRLHVKYSIFTSNFNETWIFLTDFKIFEKISNTKFHQNPSRGAALFHRTDGDRQRDMTKLIVAFRNFAHAPKKWHWHHKGRLGATKLVSNVATALPPPRPPPPPNTGVKFRTSPIFGAQWTQSCKNLSTSMSMAVRQSVHKDCKTAERLFPKLV
jgi:hypothetical protein